MLLFPSGPVVAQNGHLLRQWHRSVGRSRVHRPRGTITFASHSVDDSHTRRRGVAKGVSGQKRSLFGEQTFILAISNFVWLHLNRNFNGILCRSLCSAASQWPNPLDAGFLHNKHRFDKDPSLLSFRHAEHETQLMCHKNPNVHVLLPWN